jgi:hypothetical protein
VLVAVRAAGVFAVLGRVRCVAASGLSVMCRLLVVAGFVVLGPFGVVTSGVLVVFRGLLVVIGCGLGHGSRPIWVFFGAPGVTMGRD